MRKLDSPKIVPGIICSLIGIFCSAVGLGLVPGKINAPEWIMSFIGFLFFLTGIVLIRGKYLKEHSYIASLIFLCFSLVGLGIGFFTEAEMPTKIIFGLSSTFSLILSIYAVSYTHLTLPTKA